MARSDRRHGRESKGTKRRPVWPGDHSEQTSRARLDARCAPADADCDRRADEEETRDPGAGAAGLRQFQQLRQHCATPQHEHHPCGPKACALQVEMASPNARPEPHAQRCESLSGRPQVQRSRSAPLGHASHNSGEMMSPNKNQREMMSPNARKDARAPQRLELFAQDEHDHEGLDDLSMLETSPYSQQQRPRQNVAFFEKGKKSKNARFFSKKPEI